MECQAASPPEAVLIDSLLSVDQYRGSEKATPTDSNDKPGRDIAEVAAATELILPKGSLRTTSAVRDIHTHRNNPCILLALFNNAFCPTRHAALPPFFCVALCETTSRSEWTGSSTCTRNGSMEFWQTKQASAKLCRLLPTWPTWPAKKVSLFLFMRPLFVSLLIVSFFFFFSWYSNYNLMYFASRDLGTPPHCSENMQVAQLGG